MAKEEGFFEGPVDHTPYGDFGWIIGLVAAYFFIGAFLLFQLGSVVKHSSLFHLRLPQMSADGADADNFLQKVKDSASGATQNASDSLQQQAKDKIKEEADKQIQQQTEAAKQQAADQLKSSIPTAQ